MTIVKTKDYVYCNCVIECRVIDGDSQDLRIDLGYNLTVKTKTRVRGIDTPENSTEAGKLVTAVHWRWIKGKSLEWRSRELEKYGRSLGDLFANEESWSEYLTKNGLAHEYDGKSARKSWTEDELKAIEGKCRSILGIEQAT